ncbi:MAG: nitroreductase family protein [Bacteroidales bacterium]|nr:nitroreductase family protein [Bacteroidales bacterium]
MINTNRILKIFLIVAGIAVLTISSGKIFNYSFSSKDTPQNITTVLDNKTSFFPEIAEDFSYYKHDSLQDSYYLYNNSNKLICYLIYTSPYCDQISGFGGTVPFAIIFTPEHKIRELYLLSNSETPSWIDRLESQNFFSSWNGLTCKEASQKQVDAVSGATFTSNAVIQSMNKRLAAYSATKEVEKRKGWFNTLGIILSFIVLIFALFSFVVPQQTNRLRIGLLFASVGILGFWAGDFLSIALLHNWLINGLSIKSQIFVFIVLILSILLPLITNKSFYCQFLCPFGALQELAGKINKKKIVFETNLTKVLKSIKYVFLFVLIILTVVAVDINLEDFEPFSAFKFKFASLAVLILAVFMLFLSIFINKPWCRFFCPTGAFLSMLRGHSSKKTDKKSISISVLLNIVLVLCLGIMIYFNFISREDKDLIQTKPQETIIMSNTLEVIHSRKSVRHFTDEPVTKEQLETLVKAGMAAPSARNLQPWAFVIVTERNQLDALAEALPYAKMLLDAQAAIVVCGDMKKAATDVDSAYWVQDCSAATQNILLAVESMGLGAVWTAAFPYSDRMEPVKEILGLPENIKPLNVIPVGVPTGEDKPKDKWKPENVHWNRW